MVQQVNTWSNLTLMWAHLPISRALGWPWPMWPLTLTPCGFDPSDLWPWLHLLDIVRTQILLGKITLFDLMIPTFDLWPWPFASKKVLARVASIPSCVCLPTILLKIWVFFQSEFGSSDEKWCIRAHRALAHVCSNIWFSVSICKEGGIKIFGTFSWLWIQNPMDISS